MFLIVDPTSNDTIAMVDEPIYIRLQPNGCYGMAKSEHEAEGINFSGTVYHLYGKNAMKGTEPDAVLIPQDDGSITFDLMSQLSNFIIDQEYRLAMLELTSMTSTSGSSEDTSIVT